MVSTALLLDSNLCDPAHTIIAYDIATPFGRHSLALMLQHPLTKLALVTFHQIRGTGDTEPAGIGGDSKTGGQAGELCL